MYAIFSNFTPRKRLSQVVAGLKTASKNGKRLKNAIFAINSSTQLLGVIAQLILKRAALGAAHPTM
jgi:hypothetical protein